MTRLFGLVSRLDDAASINEAPEIALVIVEAKLRGLLWLLVKSSEYVVLRPVRHDADARRWSCSDSLFIYCFKNPLDSKCSASLEQIASYVYGRRSIRRQGVDVGRRRRLMSSCRLSVLSALFRQLYYV